MGAFDNDKTLGRGTPIKELFDIDEKFILWGVDVLPDKIEIPGSSLGATYKCVLDVSPLIDPGKRSEASVIGAMAEKLKDTEESEVPCVCKLIEFHSKQYDSQGVTVQWVEAYENAEHAGALDAD